MRRSPLAAIVGCALLGGCGQGPASPIVTAPIATATAVASAASAPSTTPSAWPVASVLPEAPRIDRSKAFLCKQLGLPCVFVELAVPSAEVRAAFAAGGGVLAPSIPLRIVLYNDGSGVWSCRLEELLIHVEAERGRAVVNRAFPSPAVPEGCRIEPGAKQVLTLELGEFLTGIASAQMKGDTLTIKAEVTVEPADKGMATLIESTTVKVAIFVPEG